MVDVEMGGGGPSSGVHGAGMQSGYVGSAFDYAQQPYDPYWAHTGNMGQVIEQRRLLLLEQWNQAHMYAHHEEVNNCYLDDRQRRMHDQWHAGQPVVADPPIVDYSTLSPYDGSVTYPTPPLHHSQWVDPHTMGHQQASREGDQGSSSSGAFGFGGFA
ncbi:hypothetical protein Hanom_Chr03g00186611 [Helianthus anomalus]